MFLVAALRGEKNSKAVADAGESCLTTEKGLYSSLSLSDNAYSDRSRAYFQRLAWRKYVRYSFV